MNKKNCRCLGFLRQLSFPIIAIEIFTFFFWLSSGWFEKLFVVLAHPQSYYGIKAGMTAPWQHQWLTANIFTPLFWLFFPVVIILECIPVILVIISVCRGELMQRNDRKYLTAALIVGLLVVCLMSVPEYLSGAGPKQALFNYIEYSLIAIGFVKFYDYLLFSGKFVSNKEPE